MYMALMQMFMQANVDEKELIKSVFGKVSELKELDYVIPFERNVKPGIKV